MKLINDNSNPAVTDAFSASLAPINRTRALTFGLLDRFCCASVFAIVMMFMRFFLAK